MMFKKIIGVVSFACMFSCMVFVDVIADEIDPRINDITISEAERGQDLVFTVDLENQGAVDSMSLFFKIDPTQIPKGKVSPGFDEVPFEINSHGAYQAVIDKTYSWAHCIEYYIEGTATNDITFLWGSYTEPMKLDITQPEYYPTEQPEVLITEVYTGGGESSDPYEFFEVYNNHFEPIDLMTYRFHYVSRIFNNYDTRNLNIEYSEKMVQWGDLASFMLDPGDVVVFAHGGLMGQPTSVDEFNAYFLGVELVENVDFFHILNEDLTTLNATGTNGASGTNSRGWAVFDKQGELVSQTFTHLATDGTNLPKGTSSLSNNGANKTSMLYGYLSMTLTETENEDDRNIWNEMISSDQYLANPGRVFSGQVPDTFVSTAPQVDVSIEPVSINIDPSTTQSFLVESLLEDTYVITDNDFEDMYQVSYRIYREETEIDMTLEGTFVPEVGTYMISVVIAPSAPNGFRELVSEPIELIVNTLMEGPTVSVINQDQQINMTDIGSIFDLRVMEGTVFIIDTGDFDREDIIVTYEVTLGDMDIDVVNHTIEPRAGTYRITMMLSPVDTDAFASVGSSQINLTFFKEPPVLTVESTVIYRTISMGQNSINLSWLYELDPGDFQYDEYTTSYHVTRQSQDIHRIGNTIMPTPGTYRVTITIEPVYPGAFETIRTTVTMIATKVPPSIQLNDEFSHDIFVSQNMNTIDLSQMFFVHGGAFESTQFTVSISVKRDQTNIPVTYQTIPAELGTYEIAIGISPKIPGSFPDVIMDDITLNLYPKLPEISAFDTTTKTVDGKDVSTINLDSLYLINTGYYHRNGIEVSYKVTKDGEAVVFTDGQISAKNGTYDIEITLSSKEGAFEDVVRTVTLEVYNQRQSSMMVVWIAIAGAVMALTMTGGLLWYRKRMKTLKNDNCKL